MQEKTTYFKKLFTRILSAVFAIAFIAFPITLTFIPTNASAAVKQSVDRTQLLKERDQLMIKVKMETADAQDLKRLEEINLILNSNLELSKDPSFTAPSELASPVEIENPKL
jgi:hypothetical protein